MSGANKLSQSRRRRQFKRYRKFRLPRQIYDGDTLSKVQISQSIRNLYTVVGQEVACPYYDMNALTTTGQIVTHVDSPDFIAIAGRYQSYQIRGVKMQVSLTNYTGGTDQKIWSCYSFMGPSVGMPGPTTIVDVDRVRGLPMVDRVNLQGQVSKFYLNYDKILRECGSNRMWSVVTGVPLAQSYCAGVYCISEGTGTGRIIGQVMYTVYIRFMNRRYL